MSLMKMVIGIKAPKHLNIQTMNSRQTDGRTDRRINEVPARALPTALPLESGREYLVNEEPSQDLVDGLPRRETIVGPEPSVRKVFQSCTLA